MIYSLRQLGRIYSNQKSFDLAKKNFAEALNILDNIDDVNSTQITQLYASILINQSLLFQKTGDLDSAFVISKKCISIIEKRNILLNA